MVAERVEVEEPGGREEERQHVAQGHGHQNEIGRRPHVLLWQDEDDQRIGDDGHDHQERHYVTVEGQGVADVQIRRDVHVARRVQRGAPVETSARSGSFDRCIVRIIFVHQHVARPVAH